MDKRPYNYFTVVWACIIHFLLGKQAIVQVWLLILCCMAVTKWTQISCPPEIYLPFCICGVGRYLLMLMRKRSWLFISSSQCSGFILSLVLLTVLWLDNCAWLIVHSGLSEVWIPWCLGDICCLIH